MNWLDIVMLIFLGVLTFLGLKSGLIKAVVLLVGIVLAIFLAGIFHDSLAEELSFVDNDSVAKILAFAIIFIPIFLIAIFWLMPFVGSIFQKILSVTFSKWADHLLGALFGFVTGWLICSAVIVLLARYAALPVDVPDIRVSGRSADSLLDLNGIRESVYTSIDESKIASFQLNSFPIVFNLLPGEFETARDFFGD